MPKKNITWEDIYKQAVETIAEMNADILFYRGHADASWKLKPSLARQSGQSGTKIEDSESVCYFDFETRAGTLLPTNHSSWDLVFSMQHHGIPTRLLDWSENFATALYFALKDANDDCCIWILNPFKLNKITLNERSLFRPQELKGNYDEYFISKSIEFNEKVVAISPLRDHPRVFRQRSGFTIHGNLTLPLEEQHDEVLKKIVIPKTAHSGAREFLKLAGISEFSLFPDLDGLARELKMEIFPS